MFYCFVVLIVIVLAGVALEVVETTIKSMVFTDVVSAFGVLVAAGLVSGLGVISGFGVGVVSGSGSGVVSSSSLDVVSGLGLGVAFGSALGIVVGLGLGVVVSAGVVDPKIAKKLLLEQ